MSMFKQIIGTFFGVVLAILFVVALYFALVVFIASDRAEKKAAWDKEQQQSSEPARHNGMVDRREGE
jgi:hypothetical protein